MMNAPQKRFVLHGLTGAELAAEKIDRMIVDCANDPGNFRLSGQAAKSLNIAFGRQANAALC
jgi:hypothetical protein